MHTRWSSALGLSLFLIGSPLAAHAESWGDPITIEEGPASGHAKIAADGSIVVEVKDRLNESQHATVRYQPTTGHVEVTGEFDPPLSSAEHLRGENATERFAGTVGKNLGPKALIESLRLDYNHTWEPGRRDGSRLNIPMVESIPHPRAFAPKVGERPIVAGDTDAKVKVTEDGTVYLQAKDTRWKGQTMVLRYNAKTGSTLLTAQVRAHEYDRETGKYRTVERTRRYRGVTPVKLQAEELVHWLGFDKTYGSAWEPVREGSEFGPGSTKPYSLSETVRSPRAKAVRAIKSAFTPEAKAPRVVKNAVAPVANGRLFQRVSDFVRGRK